MANQILTEQSLVKVHLSRVIKIRGIIIIVVAICLGIYYNTTSLDFKPDLNVTIISLLCYLMLVSLFVERAIEIILSSWRSADADKLDLKIANLKEKPDVTKADYVNENNPTYPELEKLLYQRFVYRSDSRLAALWIGMVIVSLAGVSIMGALFEISGLTNFQTDLFVGVDILLTGFVLAGGSDAINKFYKVYSSFMTRSEENNQMAR